MKDVFTKIYKYNLWGSRESVSGPGSSIYESQELINKLPPLLDLFDIHSILDAPCGDFNWMQNVPLQGRNYIGMDIVGELIQQNNDRYKNESRQFIEKDIVSEPLPKVDLIICRDALVHFPLPQILQALQNFSRSGSGYLLTTHFPYVEHNEEIPIGSWRPLNLCASPFYFKDPIFVIEETTTIKTMALWKLDSLHK